MHVDYAFFRDGKGHREHTVTVMVSKDRTTTAVSADVVPKKGIGGGFAPKQLDRVIKRYGHHGKIVLRSDGEPATKDLLSRVCQLRPSSTTVLENHRLVTAGLMGAWSVLCRSWKSRPGSLRLLRKKRLASLVFVILDLPG